MESFDAVIRTILARIRSLPAPRAPRLPEDRPARSSRGLYRVAPTDWGVPRSGAAQSAPPPLDDDHRRPAELSTTAWVERRRSPAVAGRGPRLPEASVLPSPRGLLACNPEQRPEFHRPRWSA